MIVKLNSKAGKARIVGCRSVAKYLEDKDHVASIIATRGLSISTARKPTLMVDAEPESSRAEDMDGLAMLAAYVDDRAKTLRESPSISPEAIAEMEARAALRPDIAGGWMHWSVSYAPEDRASVTDELMAEDAVSLIHTLVEHENRLRIERAEQRGCRMPKLVDEQSLLWVAATHREKDHIHFHVLICRIDAGGQVYTGRNAWDAARGWAMDAEQRHGFRRTPWRTGMATSERPKNRHADPKMAELVTAVQAIADASVDRPDLDRRLAEHGLLLREHPKRGYHLVDADGGVMQASDAGLVGRRSPDRIGIRSPMDAARADLWDAVERADDWDAFEQGIVERGLVPRVNGKGTVTSLQRVEGGKPVRGERWKPHQLGIKQAQALTRGNDAWFQRRKEYLAKRPPTVKPAPIPARISVVRGEPTTMQRLEQLVADRRAIRDRLDVREREAAERSRSKPAGTTAPTADRDAATKRKVETAVERAMVDAKPFGQQGNPDLMAKWLRARGVQTNYDERTKSWYAGIGDVLVPLPSLAGKEPRPGMSLGTAPTPAAPRPILDVDRPSAPSTGPTIPRPAAPPMPDPTPKRPRGPSR
jgi:hypothetical protein